jgi:hypothetical protein
MLLRGAYLWPPRVLAIKQVGLPTPTKLLDGLGRPSYEWSIS